jgi:formylglycine-generating enzyme required for sulfatase activity
MMIPTGHDRILPLGLAVGNPSWFSGEDRPVEQVSHDDVQVFLNRLSTFGFKGFRLPTEAEWAWAARCGAPTRWPGADRAKPVAVVDEGHPEPVAGLHSDSAGIFDQSGNVWEWAADWHQGRPEPGIDPKGPASGISRILRGSGWSGNPQDARAILRLSLGPHYKINSLGVRLLRDIS